MTDLANLEADVLAFLKRKYVQRADERQAAMGLSYTDAETSDLAREIARFVYADEVALYLEAHITIEPVFDHRRDQAAEIAKSFNFRLADLLMQKRAADTPERSAKDTFMTGHSKSRKDINERTRGCVVALQREGFKVWRYKVEDTLLDSRSEDVFGILAEESV